MPQNAGIYVHIPFCASKCSYCDFYSLAGQNDLMPKYQQALLHHIAEFAPRLSDYTIDSVYFGGGTPSYYGADRIIELFEEMKKRYNVLVNSEVTVEVNPDSVNLANLKKMRRDGINRISIGVQSANDEILKFIGRRHNYAQAEKAVEMAQKADFKNISVDLIYGLPTQTREDWSDTLTKIFALHPQHISCYGLKIEENTPLYLYKNAPEIPDDDMQADMYLYAVEQLEKYGYKQYEISNFALPGYESKHNMKYWTIDEYAGFGASAASNLGNTRYTYVKHVEDYIEAVLGGGKIVAEFEEIEDYEKASEYLMLGLRTTHGISEAEYRKIYNSNFDKIEELLESYRKAGWARFKSGRWSFTPSGFLISNRLISEVIDLHISQKFNYDSPWNKRDYYETLI